MANKATYDDANLILRLYELRREETMRKARQWFGSFTPKNQDEIQKVTTFGTQENAYMRMVLSYWDMAASMVTSGVLNEELFLESGGELLFTWEKVREIVPESRKRMNNPSYLKNLETLAQAAIKRMGPEAYEAWSAMIRGGSTAAARS
jgi:hypothetical protein